MTTHLVELIHLSDLHFGSGHRFSAPKTPDGAAAAEPSFPTLADSLIKDLTDPENEPLRPTLMASSRDANDAWFIPPMPKLVCISGDFTVSASGEEFAQAEDFVNRFRMPPPNGLGLSAEAIFVCPGNHDLDWDRPDDPLRWRAYANFLNNI